MFWPEARRLLLAVEVRKKRRRHVHLLQLRSVSEVVAHLVLEIALRVGSQVFGIDTHWIGGDPGQLEAYGWASWNLRMAILVLRNPADKLQSISIGIAQAFEPPANSAHMYMLRSPWKVRTRDNVTETESSGAGRSLTRSSQVMYIQVNSMYICDMLAQEEATQWPLQRSEATSTFS